MTYLENANDTAEYIHTILFTAKTDLELADVWFGDQRLIPKTPSVCVTLGPVEQTLVGAPRRVDNLVRVFATVYHCKLQDIQETEAECTKRADAIKTFLDSVNTAGGRFVHSYCFGVEPGYTQNARGNSDWYKSSRITWGGLVRYLLPVEMAS